jgi:hypothetical protein
MMVVAMAGLATITMFAPQATAASPQAGTVPVPNGRYGGIDAAGNMVMFTVRNRKIINPRVTVLITCRYSDGTTSEVAYGPSSSNSARTSPIPANGNGSIAWVEDFDSSLLKDAEVSVNYTFRRGRVPLASVDVVSRDPEESCQGSASFRLNDRNGTAPLPGADECVSPSWAPNLCSQLRRS